MAAHISTLYARYLKASQPTILASSTLLWKVGLATGPALRIHAYGDVLLKPSEGFGLRIQGPSLELSCARQYDLYHIPYFKSGAFEQV